MAEAHVLRIDSLPVVDRGNGIQTIPLVTKELGSKHLTTGITRFPVGAKVPMHSHNCDEQVTILEGEAEAELDGHRHRLHAYDTTLVPANKPHRFVNVGTTPSGDFMDLYFRGSYPNFRRNWRNRRSPFGARSRESVT